MAVLSAAVGQAFEHVLRGGRVGVGNVSLFARGHRTEGVSFPAKPVGEQIGFLLQARPQIEPVVGGQGPEEFRPGGVLPPFDASGRGGPQARAWRQEVGGDPSAGHVFGAAALVGNRHALGVVEQDEQALAHRVIVRDEQDGFRQQDEEQGGERQTQPDEQVAPPARQRGPSAPVTPTRRRPKSE